jgi:hypothetical protein
MAPGEWDMFKVYGISFCIQVRGVTAGLVVLFAAEVTMSLSQSVKQNAFKAVIAILALGGLAVVAGLQLSPQTPVPTLLLYTFLGGLALLALLVVAVVVVATVGQFVLRLGGTDVQWLWFTSEPAGLARMRQDAKKRRNGDE